MAGSQIIIGGAIGAGVLLGASVQEASAPRSQRSQVLVSTGAAVAGLATGSLAAGIGGRLAGSSTRSLLLTGGVAAAGAATWLIAGGRPGSNISPACASIGFAAALGGGAAMGSVLLGRRVGGLQGVVAGAVVGGITGAAMLGVGSLIHRRGPGSDSTAEVGRPPWSLSLPERSLYAAGIGAVVLGTAAGVSAIGSRVGAAGVPVRLGLGLAALGGVAWAGAKLLSGAADVSDEYGSARLAEDAPVSRLASGGDQSLIDRGALPSSIDQYIRQAITADRAGIYRADLPGMDGIRAYAPLVEGASIAEQADAAVAELDALGAFDRSMIHIVMPTGSGGVNESLVGVTEAYLGGDVATIGLQYGDRPSVLAIPDIDRGAALLHAVLERITARLSSIDGGERPQIVVSGYSLGAEVIRAARADDSTRRLMDDVVDGTMLVGPRNIEAGTGLSGLEDARIVGDGAGALEVEDGWSRADRILVVQHADDPIASSDPALGLVESRSAEGDDQSLHVPVVTLLATVSEMLTTGYLDTVATAPWRGHGYTADMPAAARVAFGIDAPAETIQRIDDRTRERLDGVSVAASDVEE